MDGVIAAHGKSTDTIRVAAKELKGLLGDPWTPVSHKKDDTTSFTVSAKGFHYTIVADLLGVGADTGPSPAMELRPDEQGRVMQLDARALGRGQGKTEGYHHRTVPIPKKISSIFAVPEDRERIAEMAKERIERVATCRRKVLWPALSTLLTAGQDGRPVNKNAAGKWTQSFDQAIDATFFEQLWEQVELDREQAMQALGYTPRRVGQGRARRRHSSSPQSLHSPLPS